MPGWLPTQTATMKTTSALILLCIATTLLRAAPLAQDSGAAEADGPRSGVWEQRRSFLRGRIYHSAVWTYSQMIVWGGGSEHQFYNDGGIYDLARDEWKEMSLTDAPSGRWGHAAVWTGREMIVWGGRSRFAPAENHDDGAIYNPVTDRWRPMRRDGAPSPRSQMAAVWTGSELLVWGGMGDGGECPVSGGSYNPSTDTWTPLPLEHAPEGRLEPAFVWTGRELIVWGGLLAGGQRSAETGGRYAADSRAWRALPKQGAPPAARGTAAVWTGQEMIVWSGSHLDGESPVNVGMRTGGRYNPATDAWRPMTLTGAPHGRVNHGVAWTGSELVVWGGGDQVDGLLRTGGRYDPAADAWTATAMAGAPSGRGIMTAVWTGEGMLLYGGSTGGTSAFNETHYYRPAPVPPRRESAADR